MSRTPEDVGLEKGDQTLEETVEEITEEDKRQDSRNTKQRRDIENDRVKHENQDEDKFETRPEENPGSVDYSPEHEDQFNDDLELLEEPGKVESIVGNYFEEFGGKDGVFFFEGSAGSVRTYEQEDTVMVRYEPDSSLMFTHNTPEIQGEYDEVPFSADLLKSVKDSDFNSYTIKTDIEELDETVEQLKEVDEYLFENSSFPKEKLLEYADSDLRE